MSEKHKQPETCIMINDTSQCSVAMWVRCGGTCNHYYYYYYYICL